MTGLLWLGLNWRVGGLMDEKTRLTFEKAAAAAIVTYYLALSVQHWASAWLQPYDLPDASAISRFMARAAVLCLGGIAGCVTFVVIAKLLRLEGLGRAKRAAIVKP
jgi:hypothetical protein